MTTRGRIIATFRFVGTDDELRLDCLVATGEPVSLLEKFKIKNVDVECEALGVKRSFVRSLLGRKL